jgi:hypothetical protein
MVHCDRSGYRCGGSPNSGPAEFPPPMCITQAQIRGRLPPALLTRLEEHGLDDMYARDQSAMELYYSALLDFRDVLSDRAESYAYNNDTPSERCLAAKRRLDAARELFLYGARPRIVAEMER